MNGRRRRKTGAGGREFHWIEWIRRLERGAGPRPLIVGIGDDAAAWLPPPGMSVVLTVDSQVEGVHFHRRWLTCREIGRRAVSASLSDLAAMAARPACILIALVMEESTASRGFHGLYRGMREEAKAKNACIAGGNLSAGPLAITVAAVGEARPADLVRRSGARPGDEIWVTGTPGLSSLGLRCLERNLARTDARRRTLAAGAAAAAAGAARAVLGAIRAFKRPSARIEEALFLARKLKLRAMIDLSDGLGSDLRHILVESSRRLGKKLGAEIEEGAILSLPGLCPLSRLLGLRPEEAAFQASDDYELCFTLPPHPASGRVARDFQKKFDLTLTRIGHVVGRPGLRLLRQDGTTVAAPAGGWKHF